jgi:hypothetical protein
MAGLLTFFISWRLPVFSKYCRIQTVAKYAGKNTKITAAGTVQDFHLVPYYPV